MMNERQLLDLKKKIESTKQEVSALKGKQEYLMQQLQNQWACSTVEEAEGKLSQIQTDITSMEEQIQKGLKELNQKYHVG